MIETAKTGATGTRFADLRLRIVSAVAIGVIALGCVWMGGWFSTILIIAAGVAMLLELGAMTTAPLSRVRPVPLEVIAIIVGMAAGSVLLQMSLIGWGATAAALGVIVAAVLTIRLYGKRSPGAAMAGFVVVAVAGVAIFALDEALPLALKVAAIAVAAIIWASLGGGERARVAVLLIGGAYIVAAVLAFVVLRALPFGFDTILWAALVVIAADVGGYFAGRIIGGPKLWPAVSPKKTWAGLGGGVALAAFVGGLFSWATTGTYFYEVCTVSMLAAVLAQGGDLAESAVKRTFGVKDSGVLIPGHGGVLDRLDGHMAALLVAAAVTFTRGQPVFVW